MNHESWALRLLAFVARLFLFVGRGIFAAIADDPQAALAFSIAVLVVLLSLPLALRALIVSERWISRRLDLHRNQDRARQEQRAFEEITAHLGDVFGDESTELPGVTHLGRPAPPPVRHALKRRRMPSVRIPRRRVRHTTSSSNWSSR